MPAWASEGRAQRPSSCRSSTHYRSLAFGLGLATGLHVILLVQYPWVQMPPPAITEGDRATHIVLGRAAPVDNAPIRDQSGTSEAATQVPSNVEPLQAPITAPPIEVPTTSRRYIDANLLTTRPRVVGDLLLIYPPAAPDGAFKAQITVHIDEQGRVVRVLVPGSELPPELAEAAISAFEAARFTPGEIDGIPVPSSMKIEVEFDSNQLSLQSEG